MNFSLKTGCRGYVVNSKKTGASNCDTCLSGFYPVYSLYNDLEECLRCDTRCQTCTGPTTCLTCTANTNFNSITKMCEFSNFFSFKDKYTVKNGTILSNPP